MKIPTFNEEERSVLENLDLLALGSRRFIELGMADRLAPAFLDCVRRFANDLALNEVDCDSPVDEANGTPDDEEQVDDDTAVGTGDSSAPELGWPDLSARVAWVGPKGKPSIFSPKLSIEFDAKELPDALTVELDFSAFRKALKNWRDAEAQMDEHKFRPDPTIWREYDALGEDRQRCTFLTPWVFNMAPEAAQEIAVDLAMLLLKRKPLLRDVCPAIAEILVSFSNLVDRFFASQPKLAKRRVASAKAAVAKVSSFISPKAGDALYLATHANGLLRSSYLYDCRAEDSLHDRAVKFIADSIPKLCKKEGLIESASPFVSNPPLDKLWSAVYNSAWQIPGQPLIIQFVVHLPDGLNTADVRVSAAIYLNNVGGRRALVKRRQSWDASGAASAFERHDGIRWKVTRSKNRDRFWGYVALEGELRIDMLKVARCDPEAVCSLRSAIVPFKVAVERYDN